MLKNNFGVDIFFDNQTFDLKITYLPKNFTPEKDLKHPKDLIILFYKNHGAQTLFGADNRFFVVLANKNNPE